MHCSEMVLGKNGSYTSTERYTSFSSILFCIVELLFIIIVTYHVESNGIGCRYVHDDDADCWMTACTMMYFSCSLPSPSSPLHSLIEVLKYRSTSASPLYLISHGKKCTEESFFADSTVIFSRFIFPRYLDCFSDDGSFDASILDVVYRFFYNE